MKLIAFVEKSPNPKEDFIIVRFKSDKTSQHFQVFVDPAHIKKIKKMDEVLLNIKFKSIIMKDLEGNKTYDTQLYSKWVLQVTGMMRRDYK
jgi:hypothetical protein